MNVDTLVSMCANAGFEIKPVEDGYIWAARAWVEDGPEYPTQEQAARACLAHIFDKLPGMEKLALAFESSFQKPEIEHDLYFEIETGQGTEIVPADVIGRTTATDVSAFLNYLEGEPVDDDELVPVKEGWLVRTRAPGYMDCSPWSAFADEGEAIEYLIDSYSHSDWGQ